MSLQIFVFLIGTISSPERCSLRGHVTDGTGQPVANARVELVGPGGETVFTDKAGAYCLAPVGAETHVHFLVTADGYQDQVTPLLAVRPGIEAQVDVTLIQRFTEQIMITGRADSLVGISASASEGSIGMTELASRPLLRSTDIMEAVPGVAMTQHSTGGHAPIILLRGYNLDHGTDFATLLDGVPLNLPSHAHAQGYTDTNFLITELIGRIDFQKGPYAATVGDFGTAGAANIELPDTIAQPFGTVDIGPYDYYRGVVGGSTSRPSGRWLYGAEASHYNGPSVVPDSFMRAKGVLQFSGGDARRGHRISAFSYGARWNATDGYPDRALTRGYVTRFGTLDATDGGRTQRHLVIGRWQTSTDRTLTRVTGYAQYYDFDLFSNLTFWTRDARLGDQIHQSDQRFSSGLIASRKRFSSWSRRSLTLTTGAQVRNDVIGIRLLNTNQREPAEKHDDDGRAIPALVSDNHINQTSVSPYVDAKVRWTPWLRGVAGVRADVFYARVESDRAANSGTKAAALVSPKLGIVFGPWRQTELYGNGGLGFHSNHANGIVQHIDPMTGSPRHADGQPVTPAEFLVRTRGTELGIRTLAVRNLQSSVSLWSIDSDSELVYAPAIGFTQAQRPGRRYGIEWNNFYRLRRWLLMDADLAWSHARYRIDPFGEGREIPDAIQGVVSAGVTATGAGRISGSLRGRYLGRRALVPDASVFSRPSFVMNGQLDIRLGARVNLGLDVFNLLGHEYDDIAYYFPTRLRDPRPGGLLEAAQEPDFVTHPGEPPTARIRLHMRF